MFSLPDAVEVCEWECPNRNTHIKGFSAWGQGENSKILVGFSDGNLVSFDRDLHPVPLYHFHEAMSFIQDVDLNDDGQKEVLVGLENGIVSILDHQLQMVGRQKFNRLTIPVRATEDDFGKFVVVSEGVICGWALSGIELRPPPSRFMTHLRQWGLYTGALVILIVISVIYFFIRTRKTIKMADGESSREAIAMIPIFARQVLSEMGNTDIRKMVCKEIAAQQKGKETFDFLFFFLGNVEIYTGSGEILPPHRRALKWMFILCYLASNPTRKIPKDKLMDLFWRDSEQKQAVQNLRLAIHRLNQELSISEKAGLLFS